MHTQKGYRVDYYLLHTGRTEWASLNDPKDDAPPLRYLRLSNPVDIISCIECYADPQIKKRLEEDFNGLAAILDEEEIKAWKKNLGRQPDHG
ncbi:MAG: hypothetical protein A2W10_03505 [Deltaproteobacteria bacterium RBG_16_55_12]|nr:MAG: hypothetical protein A2W10_03505 [Deltaproteobacteria bacterium RBG_16_55_12]